MLVLMMVPGLAVADQLLRAFLDGNRAQVAWRGQLAAARGLAPRLIASDRRAALAATVAAPAAPDSWQLLLELADLAIGPDRPLAVAAAASAREISHRLSAVVIVEQEIPRDEITARLAAWQGIAGDTGRWHATVAPQRAGAPRALCVARRFRAALAGRPGVGRGRSSRAARDRHLRARRRQPSARQLPAAQLGRAGLRSRRLRSPDARRHRDGRHTVPPSTASERSSATLSASW